MSQSQKTPQKNESVTGFLISIAVFTGILALGALKLGNHRDDEWLIASLIVLGAVILLRIVVFVVRRRKKFIL